MTIKISESELRKMLSKAVRNVLNEYFDSQEILVEHNKVDSHDAAGKDRENFFFFIPKKDGEAVFLQRF